MTLFDQKCLSKAQTKNALRQSRGLWKPTAFQHGTLGMEAAMVRELREFLGLNITVYFLFFFGRDAFGDLVDRFLKECLLVWDFCVSF